MKTNSIGKSFTIEKILKIDFQNFHILWKASKSITWTFLGSLHNETIVKYVFHEMLWKKYFTVYSRHYDYLFTAFWKNKAHGLRGKLKISRYSVIKDSNTIV